MRAGSEGGRKPLKYTLTLSCSAGFARRLSLSLSLCPRNLLYLSNPFGPAVCFSRRLSLAPKSVRRYRCTAAGTQTTGDVGWTRARSRRCILWNLETGGS